MNNDLPALSPTRPEVWRIAPHTSWRFNNAMKLKVADVVPGEPLRIEWQFARFSDRKAPDWGLDWVGSVTARFLVGDQLVYEQHNVAVTASNNGTAKQAVIIVIRDIGTARAVYRVGRKVLEVELVRTDKPGTNSYRWSTTFAVVPEQVDATWWQWRGATHEEKAWKEGFSLTGDFTNRFRFARIESLTVELSEVRIEENPQLNPCDFYPVQVQKDVDIAADGDHRTFQFDFLHDWTWLTPAVFLITGPLTKAFAYAVSLDLTDEYGNRYNGICSAKIFRQIAVSAVKQAAAVTSFDATATAVALLASAAVAAAIPFFGWAAAASLAAAAGVSYGVAAAASALAYDPPAPDRDYHEAVAVAPLAGALWPHGLTPPDDLVDLRELLEAAASIFALENARTLVRARLMGARIFDDASALALQHQGYLAIEERMTEVIGQLEQLLPRAERLVESNQALAREAMSPWLDTLALGAIPPSLQDIFSKSGLDLGNISQFGALMANRSMVEFAKENGLSFRPLVGALCQLVDAIRSERDAVLAGETYVPKPQIREAILAGEWDAAAEAWPRPRCKRC